MLGKLKRCFQKNKSNTVSATGFHFPQSGDALLNTKPRKLLLQQLWDNVSLSKSLYQRLYLQTLQNLLTRVQQLPATTQGKWGGPGGYIDLTLQFTLCAVKLARGQLLPANSAPETQSAQGALWQAVIFYNALGYHLPLLNKIEGEFKDGSPWFPGLTIPHQPFRFRFGNTEGLPRCTQWIIPRLLPEDALSWLSSVPEALHCLMVQGENQASDISAVLIKAADIVQAPNLSDAHTQIERPADNHPGNENGPVASPLASAMLAPAQDNNPDEQTDAADTQVLLSLFSDIKPEEAPTDAEQITTPTDSNLGQDFLAWLSHALIMQSLPVNTAAAHVHLVSGMVFLCVPAIFHHYLKVCERTESREALQTAFEKRQCHQVVNRKRFQQGRLYHAADKTGSYQRVSGYLITASTFYDHHAIPPDTQFLVFV